MQAEQTPSINFMPGRVSGITHFLHLSIFYKFREVRLTKFQRLSAPLSSRAFRFWRSAFGREQAFTLAAPDTLSKFAHPANSNTVNKKFFDPGLSPNQVTKPRDYFLFDPSNNVHTFMITLSFTPFLLEIFTLLTMFGPSD